MSFSIKYLLILSIYVNSLNASLYDDETLTIFAKIIPRIVLMSNQKERIKENLEVCILNDKTDERTALSLIDKIHDAYPNGITNHPLKLTNPTYASIEKCENAQLIFLLDSNDKNIEKALVFARAHHSISFAYDPKYLENGANASIFLGRKVTPYLNINSLRKNGIEIDNLLIRISKIYLNEGEK